MYLNCTVLDPRDKIRGTASIRLNWEKKIWDVESDPCTVWPLLSPAKTGLFDFMSTGPMRLLDEYRRNPAILYRPPVSDLDLSATRGCGHIYECVDPLFRGGRLIWEVDFMAPVAARWKAGMSMREKLIARLRELLPCEIGGTDKDPRKPSVTKWNSISAYLEKFPGTSCGSLPQYVSSFLGGEPLLNGKRSGAKAYEAYMKARSLSGTNKVRERGNQFGAWVEADLRKRPRMGDIYALLGRNAKGEALTNRQTDGIAHVGVILSAEGNTWYTADLGQGGGFAGKIDVKRDYQPETGKLYGEVNQGGIDPYRVVAGWVDIERYFMPE